MDKFIDISEQELIVSGTSVTPVGSADLTDTGDVFANVSVGDIVHQSTDNKYFTVATKIDSNNLTLTALDGGTAPIVSGKSFFIHSATSSKSMLVSSANVKLVEQASTSTVTITYDDPGSSSDVITITHSPVASGSEEMRDAVESYISESLARAWNQVVYSDSLPKKVIGVAIA